MAGARPVVSELFLGTFPFLELRNGLDRTLSVSSLTFEGSVTPRFSRATVLTGEYLLASISSVSAGELRISLNGTAVAYFCWGSFAPTTLQNEAVSQGLWATSGVCTPLPAQGQSLHLIGTGYTFGDWSGDVPTPLGCSNP
jgi:hypothetical protein